MSELRKDPIVERWVIIAAERGRRPSDFKPEPPAPTSSGCPFDAGMEAKTPEEVFAIRPGGGPPNSPGWEVRVVPNKFPALSTEGDVTHHGIGLLDWMTGVGAHEVVIESPSHDFNFALAPPEHMVLIFNAFIQRLQDLRGDVRFRHVIVFRNHGTTAGASLSHPHSQLIALSITPEAVREKLNAAREYYQRKERCIFCDLIEQEMALPERVIYTNEHFVALSPFAARFPFEVHIFPRRHAYDFTLMNQDQKVGLADCLQFVLRRYNEELSDPPYNLMLQTVPNLVPRPGRPDYWGTIQYDYHWHIEILPRLTKQAGFEWGTGFFINPVSPEDAAGFLRGDAPAETETQ
jgi:UDPglucose--hexose-1-phosphate uridylyltransferase